MKRILSFVAFCSCLTAILALSLAPISYAEEYIRNDKFIPLAQPGGIAVYNNQIYASDSSDRTCKIFDMQGKLVKSFSTQATGDKVPPVVGYLTVKNGFVYLADSSNGCIKKMDSSGALITKYKRTEGLYPTYTFNSVAVDGYGNVYGFEYIDLKIVKFGSKGSEVKSWPLPFSTTAQPTAGMAFDLSGNLNVVCSATNQIYKFSKDGDFLGVYGPTFPGFDIAFDNSGNIYFDEGGVFYRYSPGVKTQITVASSPSANIHRLAVSPSGSDVFAINFGAPPYPYIIKYTLSSGATTTTSTTTTLPKPKTFNITIGIQGGAKNDVRFYPPATGTITPSPSLTYMPVRVLDLTGKIIATGTTDTGGRVSFSAVSTGYTVQISYARTGVLFKTYYEFKLPSTPVWGTLVTLGPPQPPTGVAPGIK